MDESMRRQVRIAELEVLADNYLVDLKDIFGQISELKEEERRYQAVFEYEAVQAAMLADDR